MEKIKLKVKTFPDKSIAVDVVKPFRTYGDAETFLASHGYNDALVYRNVRGEVLASRLSGPQYFAFIVKAVTGWAITLYCKKTEAAIL